MMKKELIFDGKEKKIFATDEPDKIIIHFKDVATAFGGIKKAVLKDKGLFNNTISSILLEELGRNGIRNHYIGKIGEREQLCFKIDHIPLQIVVRNRLAGTTARMLGVEDGTVIPNVVYEIRYNCDELGDPMINEHHAVALGIVTYDEIHHILSLAEKTNNILKAFLKRANIELIDFKMECGRTSDGEIILSDEISPDNSRLWDVKTGDRLDKDRFRHDMSDVCASYREVMDRLVKISAK